MGLEEIGKKIEGNAHEDIFFVLSILYTSSRSLLTAIL